MFIFKQTDEISSVFFINFFLQIFLFDTPCVIIIYLLCIIISRGNYEKNL